MLPTSTQILTELKKTLAEFKEVFEQSEPPSHGVTQDFLNGITFAIHKVEAFEMEHLDEQLELAHKEYLKNRKALDN